MLNFRTGESIDVVASRELLIPKLEGLVTPEDRVAVITNAYLGKEFELPPGINCAVWGSTVGALFKDAMIESRDKDPKKKAENARKVNLMFEPLFRFNPETRNFEPERGRRIRSGFIAEIGVAEWFQATGYEVWQATNGDERRGIDIIVGLDEPSERGTDTLLVQIKSLNIDGPNAWREPIVFLHNYQEAFAVASTYADILTRSDRPDAFLNSARNLVKTATRYENTQAALVVVPSPGISAESWINAVTGEVTGTKEEKRERETRLYKAIEKEIYGR